MTLLVRDEDDIVAANLDFHLARGVDFVIVTDNRSEDRTVAILEEYERRGDVHVMHEDADDFSQGRWVTRMARMAAREFGADWVINNDADEFWYPTEGDLASVLEAVPDGYDCVRVARYNFAVVAGDDPRPFHERMTVRYAVPFDPIKQGSIHPKIAHRAAPGVDVLQGNHDASWPGRGPLFDAAPVEILHFPIREWDRFAAKIANVGAAYARNTELPQGYGQWKRRLYDAQRNGEFAEVFDRVVLDQDAVVAGLASGDLVEDRRIAEAMMC